MKPLVILLVACAAAAHAGVSELARRFAPVVWQECRGRSDYLAAFDYDGNWDPLDNWENLDRFPQKATVYAGQIETRTHAYLFYVFFHPRDWWRVSVMRRNHENDLNGALVVVDKTFDPKVLAVQVGPRLLRYSSDAGLAADGVDGAVRLERERPILRIGAFDHLVSAYQGRVVAREKGIRYRYGGVAEVPASGDERNVSYDLVDLDALWSRRHETGKDKLFSAVADLPGGSIGVILTGDNWNREGAEAPWVWGHDPARGLARGDWFFDPAKAMRALFPHQADRFPSEYTVHPYRPAAPPAPRPRRVRVAPGSLAR